LRTVTEPVRDELEFPDSGIRLGWRRSSGNVTRDEELVPSDPDDEEPEELDEPDEPEEPEEPDEPDDPVVPVRGMAWAWAITGTINPAATSNEVSERILLVIRGL